jgi:hypothetical protein
MMPQSLKRANMKLSAVVLPAISLTAILFAGSTMAAPVKVTYISVVSDTHEPLEANIEKVLADNKKQNIDHTRLPKGDLTPNPPIECKQGERLHVFVDAGAFLGRYVDCSSRLSVTLTRWVTMRALKEIQLHAFTEGDYGLAALAGNEMTARLNWVPTTDLESTLISLKAEAGQPNAASDISELTDFFQIELTARKEPSPKWHMQTVEYKTLESVGKYLDVKKPAYFDPKASKFVLSAESQDALMLYQKNNGLKPSGKLDYFTLKDFAGVDIGDAMTKWATLAPDVKKKIIQDEKPQ